MFVPLIQSFLSYVVCLFNIRFNLATIHVIILHYILHSFHEISLHKPHLEQLYWFMGFIFQSGDIMCLVVIFFIKKDKSARNFKVLSSLTQLTLRSIPCHHLTENIEIRNNWKNLHCRFPCSTDEHYPMRSTRSNHWSVGATFWIRAKSARWSLFVRRNGEAYILCRCSSPPRVQLPAGDQW